MNGSKKTRSELKREAILSGGLAAFQQYGVKETSMDKIAEVANVSKRTVYNHFESKEALVAEILTQQWLTSNASMAVNYDADTPLTEQLITLALAYINFASNSQVLEFVRVALGHFMHHPESLALHTKKFFCEETSLKRWIKLATEDGKLVIDDIDFAAEQFASLIKGYALWPQLLQYGEPLTEPETQFLAEQTVAMFLSRYQA